MAKESASSRETEFKRLLQKDGLQRLLDRLGKPISERHFSNCYYGLKTPEGESQDLRQDWVLRLRVEGDNLELTLKIGAEVSPGVFDSMEHSERVFDRDPKSWEESLPLIVLRKDVSRADLEFIGQARNHRRVFAAPVRVGDIWEVDSCSLPNGETFHELEVEVALADPSSLETFRHTLDSWLNEQQVDCTASLKTKYARFLASLAG